MSDCGCGEFDLCVNKLNCKRYADCGCEWYESCVKLPNCKRTTPVNELKERVRDEKAFLDERRGKLEYDMLQPSFVNLPRAEKERLLRQSIAMEQYSQVLFERLEADFQ